MWVKEEGKNKQRTTYMFITISTLISDERNVCWQRRADIQPLMTVKRVTSKPVTNNFGQGSRGPIQCFMKTRGTPRIRSQSDYQSAITL
jgi:hypothetical protein